jgi:hypothetical protein
MADKSYMNPWQFKPWWCQPWSVLLTGGAIVLGSWTIWNNIWLTVLIALPISIWMGYFVVIWPILMQPYLLENSSATSDREKT